MNKFYKYAAMAGTFVIGLTSCSDSFLDVESVTESNTDTFYKTETDANRALIGCYDGYRQTHSAMDIGFYCLSEVMSMECFGGTGIGDDRKYQCIDRFDFSQDPAQVSMIENDWKRYYQAIYRYNELISREEQIQWNETNSKRGTYMGEVRGLRGMTYFEMTRLWGSIPLYTLPENVNKPQATPEEIYQLIFEDLKYAAENIPADAYPKAEAAKYDGRMTCYAAKALLARAYLFYTGYYGQEHPACSKADALMACEDIIASGEFDLVPEFKNLWPAAAAQSAEVGDMETLLGTYAGDGNIETIFAVKFTGTQDYNGNNDSNRWQVMLGRRDLNVAPYGKGWGALSVNPEFVALFNQYGGPARLNASIIDHAAEGLTSDGSYSKMRETTREYTGYTIKKYSPLCFADGTSASKVDGTGDFQTQNHQDFVIVRYADVLLMAAELGSSDATKYLNKVRTRAGLPDATATKENILRERQFEFAFEAINYWDVLRQGLDVAAQKLECSQKVFDGFVESSVVISGARVKATKGLCQIPKNQIDLSDNMLSQNEGW